MELSMAKDDMLLTLACKSLSLHVELDNNLLSVKIYCYCK